jgi:hypothetical protein
MTDRERKQAAADALRNAARTTDLPAALRPYPANTGTLTGLSSGSTVVDHRTPQQRAVHALRLNKGRI